MQVYTACNIDNEVGAALYSEEQPSQQQITRNSLSRFGIARHRMLDKVGCCCHYHYEFDPFL